MKTIFAIFILFGLTAMSCSKEDDEYAKREKLHDLTYVFVNPNDSKAEGKYLHIQSRGYKHPTLYGREDFVVHDKGRIGDQCHLAVDYFETTGMGNIVMKIYVNGNLAVEMSGNEGSRFADLYYRIEESDVE